ncbi:unnamed protein product, partial [Discosporangium mesarthrocarpum]
GDDFSINFIDGVYQITTAKRASSKTLTVRLEGLDKEYAPEVAYYEAVIETRGSIIVGLAGPNFQTAIYNTPYYHELGDHAGSWGYDGTRGRKLCCGPTPYGSRWKVGSVVSVLYNKCNGEIRFGLNGEDLGVAFEVPAGEREEIRPAITIHNKQSVRLNFGEAPLAYDRLVPRRRSPAEVGREADIGLS